MKNSRDIYGIPKVRDLEDDLSGVVSNLQRVLRVVSIEDRGLTLVLPFVVVHFGYDAAARIPNPRGH
jgi:hypothetical protein